MACSVLHTIDEIQALAYKLIDEDKARQKAIMELVVQFDNACKAKDDMRKAYKKCNDIPQKSRALIDTFLKEESDKDYEMNLSIGGNEGAFATSRRATKNLQCANSAFELGIGYAYLKHLGGR
ncbi:hypothetical protein Tco_0484637 [Tanacetum coccineum]